MKNRPHSAVLLPALLTALVGVLTACGSDDEAGTGDTGAQFGAPSSPAAGGVEVPPDCADGVVTLSGSASTLVYDGECERVEINGHDLDIDVEQAVAAAIIVRGDRNDVDAGGVATLLVEGQSNEVSAPSIGSAEVRGDRNELDVADVLGSLVVRGNDNSVEALEVTSVDDSGQRNTIGTD